MNKHNTTSVSMHIRTCGCGLPKWWLIEQVEVKNLGQRETYWIQKLKATINKNKTGNEDPRRKTTIWQKSK